MVKAMFRDKGIRIKERAVKSREEALVERWAKRLMKSLPEIDIYDATATVRFVRRTGFCHDYRYADEWDITDELIYVCPARPGDVLNALRRIGLLKNTDGGYVLKWE